MTRAPHTRETKPEGVRPLGKPKPVWVTPVLEHRRFTTMSREVAKQIVLDKGNAFYDEARDVLAKGERDLLQNHTQGRDVSSRHYDRWDYMPEKRAAVARWGAWVEAQLGAATTE